VNTCRAIWILLGAAPGSKPFGKCISGSAEDKDAGGSKRYESFGYDPTN
jgi:hypothetical protein